VRILNSEFYSAPAVEIAPKLLGKFICIKDSGEIKKYRITETECYWGEEDTACHASKGRTARTDVMYRAGGVLYVYLCYGMHYMLNIVTGREGHPEAVLIRGVEGASGPGRVTKLLRIDKTYNGCSIVNDELRITNDELWIEDDGAEPEYIATKRIGIGYAGKEDQDRLWRYEIKKKKIRNKNCGI